jgi:RNA polymerase sigma-70 factor (ECF subfamily)
MPSPTATAHPLYSLGLTNVRPMAGRTMLGNDATPLGIAALTQRLAAGDEAAFREFHAQYFDRLYQFLLVVARGQEHEAREALQETLLRVARSARPFDNETVFWCWLKAIARNAARDAGRKRSRYAALLHSFAFFKRPELPSAPATADARLTAVLDECLAELSADDRALVQGKYFSGATVTELAHRTGLTCKAVESRLSRLRHELRDRALAKLRQP